MTGTLLLAQLSQAEVREKILHTWESAKHSWVIPLHIGPIDISINKAVWFLWIGAGSFVVRLVFAAAVLGIPAYLGLWPVVPMLAGFAGVYVAENVAAAVRMSRTRNQSSAKPGATAREGAGRRAEN